jgi:twinkle protein
MTVLTACSSLDFIDRLSTLYERGMPRGNSTGWRSVDEHYTVQRGQWSLITGIPGHGKSEWLDALLINLSRASWQFVIFSPENQPHEFHVSKLLEKATGKPFGTGPSQRMSTDEMTETAIDLANKFSFLTVNQEFVQMPSVHSVIEAASEVITEWRKNGLGKRVGVVIDPWNEMDHGRPANQTETEYISQTLSFVRQFARDWEVHVWIVAHPKQMQKDKDGKINCPRPYDVSGSAHWYNKADNCIAVFRDVINGGPVQIHVQKVRFKHIGKPGIVELNYDKVTGQYIDPNWVPTRKEMAGGETCPI